MPGSVFLFSKNEKRDLQMSFDNIAISIKDIRKCFYVYNNPHDRLKQFVLPRLKRLITSESENYYKEFWALNGISFDVMKGETVGLIGKMVVANLRFCRLFAVR